MKIRNIVFAVMSFGIVSSQALADDPNTSTLEPAKHNIQWYLSNGYYIRSEATTASQNRVNFLLDHVDDHNTKIVVCTSVLTDTFSPDTVCYAITKEHD